MDGRTPSRPRLKHGRRGGRPSSYSTVTLFARLPSGQVQDLSLRALRRPTRDDHWRIAEATAPARSAGPAHLKRPYRTARQLPPLAHCESTPKRHAIAPARLEAPPTRAARPPSTAKKEERADDESRDHPRHWRDDGDEKRERRTIAKVAAEANAAWIGRALSASENPNSSRERALRASYAMSCAATSSASGAAGPRLT